MKDIIISVRRQKTELWFLAGSFVAANLANLWAIYTYGAPVKEMLTSFFYVLAFTLFIYALTVVVRLLIHGIGNLIFKNKKTNRKSL